MDLLSVSTLLIDGDGVLWRGNDALPGLSAFFDVLNQHSIRWALLTNNATRHRSAYLEKLAGLGIEARADQIFTSGVVTARYLAEQFPDSSVVYVLGEDGLQRTLREAGFDVRTGPDYPANAAAVVAGMDRALTYDKLAVATRLIRTGVPFVGTNPDRTIPSPLGLLPGAGTTLAALRAATDVEPTVIGKPEPAIFRSAMRELSADPDTTAMLGDRLETDILGAQKAGIGTIGVLTGVMTRESIERSDYRPDFVFDSIAELTAALDHNRS